MAATTAMSAALGLADVAGVMDRQPPRKIVATLLPHVSDTAKDTVAVVAHLGYGTAAGSGYALLFTPRWRNRTTGAAYGVAIWALGYEGWLPAMGILPPAHRDDRGRAITMFAAHVVYGVALGAAGRQTPTADGT